MSSVPRRRVLATAAAALAVLASTAGCRGASNEDATNPGAVGVTNTEIKIGGSFPFSGGLAVYGSLSQGINAYFEQINAKGGIEGRKIVYTALDDGYDPSRLAANTRKLIEQEKVFALVSFGGTNLATRDYMKTQNAPQFVLAGNSPLSDIKSYPMTRAWWPDIHLEGALTAQYVLTQNPNAKIGTLALNNDLSKSLVDGIKEGLGDKSALLIDEETFEPSATDLSGQINKLKAAGVDTIIAGVSGPQGASALKYIGQIGWKPTIFNYSNAASRLAFTDPAGSAAVGVRAAQWMKDPADPQWAQEQWMKDYRAAVEKYGKGAKADDLSVLNGYAFGQAFVNVLSTMDAPTREGLIKAWDAVRGMSLDALVPGAQLNAGPDGRIVHSYRIGRFDGTSWVPEGDVIDALAAGLTSAK